MSTGKELGTGSMITAASSSLCFWIFSRLSGCR